MGGSGNDICLVDNAADVVTEGFATVYASVGYTLSDASEIEFLIGDTGAPGVANQELDVRRCGGEGPPSCRAGPGGTVKDGQA